jgi:hypothetical protein
MAHLPEPPPQASLTIVAFHARNRGLVMELPGKLRAGFLEGAGNVSNLTRLRPLLGRSRGQMVSATALSVPLRLSALVASASSPVRRQRSTNRSLGVANYRMLIIAIRKNRPSVGTQPSYLDATCRLRIRPTQVARGGISIETRHRARCESTSPIAPER